MGDFTIYFPTDAQREMAAKRRIPLNVLPGMTFMAFHAIDAKAECEEATLAEHLGLPMGAVSAAIFARLESGERKEIEGRIYCRHD